MSNAMMFPNSVDEFMEQYKITDTEQVYTNGVDLIPIFRMKQWFEHERTPIMTNWQKLQEVFGDKARTQRWVWLCPPLADGSQCNQRLCDQCQQWWNAPYQERGEE